MIDRNFNETDLRQMLGDVVRVEADSEPDRWTAMCRLEGAVWEVVREPMPEEQRTLVITAYRLD